MPTSTDGSPKNKQQATTISIIIPTLNEAKIIESTLQTLAATLTIPYEVIISDGGSTDGTIELAKPYATAVVVYQGTARQTISQGRNAGAKIAQGAFLVFLDADCVIPEPDKFFGRTLGRFGQEPQLVAQTVFIRVFPSDETIADKLIFGICNLGLVVSNNLLRSGHAFGEFQMIRRDAFNQVGGYREELVTIEDADMFRRLSRIGRTKVDPHLTVFHTGRRMHQVGWVPLIAMWLVNTISMALFDRPVTKEWKPIR